MEKLEDMKMTCTGMSLEKVYKNVQDLDFTNKTGSVTIVYQSVNDSPMQSAL